MRRVVLALGPDGILSAVALLGIAILSIFLGGRLEIVLDSAAPVIVFTLLLGITTVYKLPLLLERRRGDRARFVSDLKHTVRAWAPFALLYVCYRALRGTMNAIVTHGGVQDRLKAMDEAIFGVSPSWWMERFSTPWLTELMSFGYALMFVLPMAVLILCHVRERRRDFREIALAVLAAFYVGFVIYLLVPAKSPRIVYEYATELHGYGLYEMSARAWDSLQLITYDAFPSLHTAISAVALIYAWRFGSALSSRRPRLLFWIFLPNVILLQISTMYLRQHYFVDVVAGWALAIVSVWLAGQLVRAWDRLRAVPATPGLR
jgi:membrane-associated phospholipid phosphatase